MTNTKPLRLLLTTNLFVNFYISLVKDLKIMFFIYKIMLMVLTCNKSHL